MRNEETEVVVGGYGGAGAAAAITAHDAGAKVIIIEKTERGGGNTRSAGGSVREYFDAGKAAQYYLNISLGTMDRDVCQAFVAESLKSLEWLKGLGGELEIWRPGGFPPTLDPIWPHLPGAEGIGPRWRLKGAGRPSGADLWALLARNVAKRNITVLSNTAARQLVTNKHGEITGVIADSPQGEVRIKASRAVILTCGGFEYDARMQLDYLGLKLYALGTPANTGDGIRMAQEVGADLWHMVAVSCCLGYKVPEYEIPFLHRIRTGGYIYVDQNGKRFIDEAGTDIHAMAFSFCHLDHKSLTYPRIPAYVIFDENTRQHGPIIHEAAWVNQYYQWSEDNMSEIQKGWIKTAGSIRDLALQIGLDAGVVEQSVTKYNSYCNEGHDPELGRRPETLSPIARPPFYAIAVVPALLNTQGGPRRNTLGQVLDIRGRPIKRLYSAGELGSIWGIIYPGAGNISECLAFGRIAGRNAAAEKPWGK